jgi:FkbM family methyltransferase
MLYTPEDPFDLILKDRPDWAPAVIFDVGANTGQSAVAYARRFPETIIHSFEPAKPAHAELTLAALGYPNVVPHRLALGRATGRRGITRAKRLTMNRILPEHAKLAPNAAMIDMQSGADAMRALDIDRIDYLKIDTEGHDLDVLHGFLPVIDRIDFIEVEAAMNPYNSRHVPFAAFEAFLRDAGFHLAYIFQQKLEWQPGARPLLRRCNPLFVNGRLLDLPSG